MYKKLALALVTLIFIMVAISLPVLAEPQTDGASSLESVSSIISDESVNSEDASSVEGDENTSSDVSDTQSGEGTSSEGDESEVSSGASSTGSKFYIPDDSTYFTESLNSLGGHVTSGSLIVGDENNTSSNTQNNNPQGNTRFSLQDMLKKFLWMPIAVIAICVLVLIIFNKVYELKYKAIDPEEKIKAQKRTEERRKAAAKRAAEARRKGNNPRRPRQ